MDKNFGQGSALLGGSSPLQQVFQQYQQGEAGATQMQTPNSPGFDPSTLQAPVQGGPPPPAPQGAPQGAPAPQMPGLPGGSIEAETIINALTKRLENDSKIRLEAVKPSQPPLPVQPY